MKELEILLNKRWVLKSRDKETYYKLRDALGELDPHKAFRYHRKALWGSRNFPQKKNMHISVFC